MDDKFGGHRQQDGMADILYKFYATDAGDVRHMLVQASELALKQGDHRLHAVLQAQAEAVMAGLHQRNLDEVPDMMGDIVRFHQKFGQEYVGKPRVLPSDLFLFRSKFHQEEQDEYLEEQDNARMAYIMRGKEGNDAVVEALHMQLDALVDLTYVVLGTAYLQFGAPVFNEAWRRVQEKNMAKVRCERDEDSTRGNGAKFDVIKPEGWTPPDHRDLVTDFEGRIERLESSLNPGHENDTSIVRK